MVNVTAINKDQTFVRDPVCGAEVNINDSVVLIMSDQTYYFCSDACARVFMRYLQIVTKNHEDECGCGGNCSCGSH